MVAAFGTFIPETHSEYRLVRGCLVQQKWENRFFPNDDAFLRKGNQ